MNKKYNIWIVLLMIMIAGAVLRFYHINYQSLWYDEVHYTANFSNFDNYFEAIRFILKRDIHPPGYMSFIYFLSKYIGNSETILRVPSAISGVLAVFFIFLLASQLYSYREGIISSILMAFLWCPIYYSQEVRAYSTIILLVTVITYAWTKIIRKFSAGENPSLIISIFYVITAALLSYLHYIGFYFVLLQLLGTLVYFNKKHIGRIFLLYIPVIILYIPVFPYLSYQLKHSDSFILDRPLAVGDYFEILKYFFNNSNFVLVTALLMYLVFLVKYVLKITRSGDCKKSCSIADPDFLLIIWLAIPFLLFYLKSKISTPIYRLRSFLIILPAAYILLSRSITILFTKKVYQIAISSLMILLFLYHLIFGLKYYSKITKAQWREATEYIAANSNQGNKVFVLAYSWDIQLSVPELYDYYFNKLGLNVEYLEFNKKELDINRVKKIIKDKNISKFWIINTEIGPPTIHVNFTRYPDIKFVNMFKNNFILLKHKDFFRAHAWLFKTGMK